MVFENLNKEQIEAVKATEGLVRVVAGAGSGKTRVLAHRYAYLVDELGVDPASILCITFTNKAAQEMRARIAKLVTGEHVNDFVCTVHGFCVKFLREEIHRIGYPKNFQILDEEDSITLAKEVLAEKGIPRDEMTAEQLLHSFHKFKLEEDYISEYLLTTSEISEEESENPSVMLLLKQRKYLSLDFQDLIFFTGFILQSYPEVCEKWQRRMNYIMVDEVQDCDVLQWDIFTTLAGFHHNLFIVGDPDQSIYEWRGGSMDLLLQFKSDKDIILERNYRSTSTILGAANSIIANNAFRIEKNLYTLSNTGTIITHFHGKNEQEESDWISSQILEMNQNGGEFSDNAILIRASYLSRSIEQSFLRHNISYVIWGGVRFFERKEIKDALSYLRLIAFDDDVSFKRIANVPSRKIGTVTMRELSLIAEEKKCSLFSALEQYHESLSSKKESIGQFISLILKYREIHQDISVSDLLNKVLIESGLLDFYREDTEEDRLENLTELLNSVKLYEDEHKEDDITLETYLQDVALYTNADYTKDKNRVKIMTIHQAKGLEFPNVFIAGLSEGILPNRRSVRERKERGLEEERRLMYVAITRAENKLFLTESEGFLRQQGFNKYPSRFLREIKAELFVTEGDVDEEIWKNAESFKRDLDKLINEDSEMDVIEVGSTVVHSLFGEGTVTDINDDGRYCTVEFQKVGIRSLRMDKLSLKTDDQPQAELSEEDFSVQPLPPRAADSREDLMDKWNEAIKVFRLRKRVFSLLKKATVNTDKGRHRVIIPVQNEEQKNWIQAKMLPRLEKEVLSDDGIHEIVISIEND